jgi:hypothetical protein
MKITLTSGHDFVGTCLTEILKQQGDNTLLK